jgi:hypothetical protein
MTGFLVGLYIGVFVGIVGVCLFSMSKWSTGETERRLEDGPTFRKQNRWRV